MRKIYLACVWVKGPKNYTANDVRTIAKSVKLWAPPDRNVEFICLTDQPHMLPSTIKTIDIRFAKLTNWWAKMCLFEPSWREGYDVKYIDLDTLLVNNISPFLDWQGDFAICESFTKEVHAKHWPCEYGSCVMSIGAGWGAYIWNQFRDRQSAIMQECGRYGDQMAIQKLNPDATLLQHVLPKDFFLGYRRLKDYPNSPPHNTAMVIFAGSRRPGNFGPAWTRDFWKSY